ncbi:MAG: TAXI family TRAP transporter solute-binding subunit [Alphaproteobacteria bacterium]
MKRNKNYLARLVVLLVVSFCFIGWSATPPFALAQSHQEKWPDALLMEGMSVGSSAYMVAAAFCSAIREQLGIRTQTTAGVPLPVMTARVGSGESQLGYTISELPYDAFRGLHGWKGRQLKDLRILSHVVYVSYHFITWPGTGVKSIGDLKGKTVMGDQGGVRTTGEVTRSFLAANGLSGDDVKIVTWREWGEQVSFVRMKLGHAINFETVVGTAPVAELDRSIKWNFVPLKKNEIESAIRKIPYIIPYTIPVGSYTQVPEPYLTVAYSVGLTINSKVPDSLAYELCKVLYDKPGRFVNVHPLWGKFDINSATVSRTAPFHAGTIKYYKEKGVWNPELDGWQKGVLREVGLEK